MRVFALVVFLVGFLIRIWRIGSTSFVALPDMTGEAPNTHRSGETFRPRALSELCSRQNVAPADLHTINSSDSGYNVL